jgi:type 1 glutamine amidotransferase
MGGNYTGHHGNKIKTRVSSQEGAGAYLAGGKPATFMTSGSLYINTPLQDGARPLFMGRAEGIERSEPVAWTYLRKDGGRSFYTSLGYVEDFEEPAFQALLVRGVKWSLATERAPAGGSK